MSEERRRNTMGLNSLILLLIEEPNIKIRYLFHRSQGKMLKGFRLLTALGIAFLGSGFSENIPLRRMTLGFVTR